MNTAFCNPVHHHKVTTILVNRAMGVNYSVGYYAHSGECVVDLRGLEDYDVNLLLAARWINTYLCANCSLELFIPDRVCEKMLVVNYTRY